MASPSILRSSRTATFSLVSTKPILKRSSRPAALPLSPSPFPFSASFNLMVSACATASSPHVHFPPSPFMFSTLSPPLFSNGSLPITPNNAVSAEPMLSPPTVPFLAFKLADLTKAAAARKRNKAQKPTAGVVKNRFEDPRSPRPAPMPSLNAAALKLGGAPSVPRPKELRRALTTFPRSPFPSAPLSPEKPGDDKAATPTETAAGLNAPPLKRRNTADNALLTTRPLPPRSTSLADHRNTIAFQLTSSCRLAPPHLDLSAATADGGISFSSLSPVSETAPIEINLEDFSTLSDAGEVGGQAVPLGSEGNSAQLSNAFWQSVSLEEGLFSARSGSSGFPESVSGSQGSVDIEEPMEGLEAVMENIPRSPPTLLFGNSDGAVWSAGPLAEQPEPRHNNNNYSHHHPLMFGIRRSMLTAPSPKDPLAKFPSFVSAFESAKTTGEDQVMMLQPPPRAHLMG